MYIQAPFEELIPKPDLDHGPYIIVLPLLSVFPLKTARKRNFIFRINCACFFRVCSHSPFGPGRVGYFPHLPDIQLLLSGHLFGNAVIWNIHRPSITKDMAWLICYFRKTQEPIVPHCFTTLNENAEGQGLMPHIIPGQSKGFLLLLWEQLRNLLFWKQHRF